MGPGEKEEGKAGPSDLKSESLGVKGTCGSSAGSPLSRGGHQPPHLSWGMALLQLRVHTPLPNAGSPEPTLPRPGPPADCLIQGLVGHKGALSSCFLPEAQVTGLLGSIRRAWRAGSRQVKARGAWTPRVNAKACRTEQPQHLPP